ncbi:cell division protein FtsB [Rhodoferax lithotrophicus]|uniref:Cell division protein FtsB n=1 Tax=Rhodoferax lithotrophicus TaxID=2798804 RepID=A0ABM7MMT0_9BURK|nr:septum formation initiator family protein [Rhodoferax sp. MIZ03]BCO27585.1 cell division protein FtsB [Rhodoferax sp. MIZ03]
MGQRAVPVVLLTLLVILHAQMWFGRGSVSNVAHLRTQLAEQVRQNNQTQLANDQLAAEVRDLKEGLEMIEEKARMELGMIKTDEIYVQIAR